MVHIHVIAWEPPRPIDTARLPDGAARGCFLSGLSEATEDV
jgi:hypothetical protein